MDFLDIKYFPFSSHDICVRNYAYWLTGADESRPIIHPLSAQSHAGLVIDSFSSERTALLGPHTPHTHTNHLLKGNSKRSFRDSANAEDARTCALVAGCR